MTLRDQLAVATDIAIEAGDVLVSYFRSDRVDVRTKGERDVVTAADTAAEDLVLRRLEQQFPHDGVIGEEGGTRPGANGGSVESTRVWCIDPLDGTLNYSRGVPVWCVSLSLFEADTPVLGVIHDPLGRETFAAARGLGAQCNGSPLQSSGLRQLSSAFVHMTIDFHEHSVRAGLDDILAIAPRVLRTRNTGSAALALAYVAAGRFDGMLHRFANPWDYGAGVVLIEESGGRITGMDGDAYTIQTRAVVAGASEELHRDLLDLTLYRADVRVQ